jgi:hypothetical protein
MLLAAAGALADERPLAVEAPSPYFSGTYLSAVAGGGIGLLDDDSLDGRIGGGVEVGGRLAMVLQLLDVELLYRYGRYSPSAQGVDVALDRHSFVLDAKVHPLFLILMAGQPAIAGLYVQTGLSGELASFEAPAAGVDDSAAGIGVHVGCGIDVPVTNPNRGSSFWVGFNYRANFTTLDPSFEALDDLDEHLFAIQLHYRHNNLQYGHLPRPSDFGF